MSDVDIRDREWLEKQIRIAVEGYLQEHASEIAGEVSEQIVHQLVAEGENRYPDDGRIVIRIDY